MVTRVIVSKKHIHLRPAQQIALSFIVVILIGTLFLSLPISQTTTSTATLLDHFFIATSAVCVTGLTPLVIVETYSLFGQTVLIFLMQIGGLGLMTLIAIFLLAIGGRLAHSDKMVVQEAINRNTMQDIGKFLKFIIGYTFLFELVGMILLSFVFIPEFGLGLGLFKSLFISVSAFCNAGFDVIGSSSLQPYVSNVLVNLVVSTLIIMGGLGFSVWFDLTKSGNSILHHKSRVKKVISHLQVHVKLVIWMTIILLAFGWIYIFVMEFTNVATLGQLSLFDKLMASFFQSTTLRTAGFATLDISAMRPATLVLMMAFMFIGGSPGGTAGGIKTTTFALVILMVITELINRDQLVIFRRTIGKDIFRRALAVLVLSFTFVFLGLIALTMVTEAEFLVIAFEAFSAMGTVGLSMGLTPELTSAGKVVIIILMFVGRIGPIAVAFSLKGNRKRRTLNEISYPSGNVVVG